MEVELGPRHRSVPASLDFLDVLEQGGDVILVGRARPTTRDYVPRLRVSLAGLGHLVDEVGRECAEDLALEAALKLVTREGAWPWFGARERCQVSLDELIARVRRVRRGLSAVARARRAR